MKELDDLIQDKSSQWAVQTDSKKKGQELYFDQCAKTKRGMMAIRCWTYTDYDPVTSVRAYTNPEIRMQYDKNV